MNADDIYPFLDTLAIGRLSRYTYVGTLRAFQAFVREGTPASEALSLDALRAWFRHDAARSPLTNVMHRAGIIMRYLNWRVAAGNGTHPLATLQGDYGRHLHPIIRALLEDEYKPALERLRPWPTFGSPLGPLMGEHIARMQALGYRYETQARDLRRFDRFLQQHPELTGEPLPVLLTAWRDSCLGLRHALCVQQCGRILFQALHRRDPTTPVPSIEADLQRRVVQE